MPWDGLNDDKNEQRRRRRKKLIEIVVNIGGICVDCFKYDRNAATELLCTLELSHYLCRRILKGNKFINSTAAHNNAAQNTQSPVDTRRMKRKKYIQQQQRQQQHRIQSCNELSIQNDINVAAFQCTYAVWN